MAIPVDVLDLLAHDLLDALVEALAVPGVEAAPAMRYVAAGPPAHLCEQTVTWVEAIAPKIPAGGAAKAACLVVPHVALRGAVVRCASTTPTPDAATLDGEGSRQAVDVWAVWSHLVSQWTAGSLFPSVPSLGCQHVDWQPGVRTSAPQGGLVAVTVGCTLTIT